MSTNRDGHEEVHRVRRVGTAFAVRVRCASEPAALSRLLTVLQENGGELRAHLFYRVGEATCAHFLCEKPHELALALREKGDEVDVETVVTARTENRPGALSHLVRTLETAGVAIEYSYAAPTSDDLLVVLRTQNNPKAEDVLRNYLCLADPGLSRSGL